MKTFRYIRGTSSNLMKNTLHTAAITLVAVALFLPLLIFSRAEITYAQGNPQDELSVKDYSWKSYGVGRLAVLGEITLANSGKNSYKNIKIRVDLFTRTGKFSGSLQGTIPGELSAESEKTFTDLSLGLMNSDLENSEAMVTGAEISESSPLANAEDVIFIKNWKFESTGFGKGGFITEITLENTGKTHFKNIKILLTEKSGGGAAGGGTNLSSLTIHDVLPAGTERVFTGINVGFSNPDALERSITISGAEEISAKELNYILAGGGSIGQKIKEKITSISVLRKKAEPEREEALLDKPADGTADDKADSTPPPTEETMDKGTTDEGTELSEEQLREPFPKYDIVIKEFEWGSGVPGSTATLRKLVIENTSSFTTYEKIEFEIEFFKNSSTPFGSNRFKVRKILAPEEVMHLENVQVGFISKLPDPNHIKLRVVKAKAVK